MTLNEIVHRCDNKLPLHLDKKLINAKNIALYKDTFYIPVTESNIARIRMWKFHLSTYNLGIHI